MNKRGLSLVAALLAGAGVSARAQDSGDVQTLSIEQLGDTVVTGVARRPEPLHKAPAAVYVITAEDIRRSGTGSLPEVLRLAPNLEVAKMNGYAYTITARGFNSPESANKILVLIDGRSVYSPLASTVFWENVDVPLGDIARIEVVSGPGGTLYGANAVNGVINIITKNAADTQGGLGEARVNVISGAYRTMLRYGISPWDGGAVRLYGQASRNGGSQPETAADLTRTGWARYQGGFRFDQILGDDTFNFEGDLYANHNPQQNLEKGRGANLNGHWTHAFESGSSIVSQITYDQSVRIDPTKGEREQLESYDAQVQHNTSLGLGDSFSWGGEYRRFKESYYSKGGFFLNPTTAISIGSIFAQDEIPLLTDLKLTLGLKLEDNSYSGLDVMPNLRLAWETSDSGLLWASVSQAARTPSKIDRELQFAPILNPSPNFASEHVTAYEAGYRGEPLAHMSFSASVFYNVYGDLRSDQVTPVTIFPITLVNGTKANTYGAEIWAKYTVMDWWRLSAGVNWLHRDFTLNPGQVDFAQGQSGGQDPASQAQLRSYMDLFENLELDTSLRFVGKVTQEIPSPSSGAAAGQISLVPSYFEGDVRLGWRVTPATEIAFNALNLLHDRHLEAHDPSTYAPQYVGRSFIMYLRQSF
jgi:iron complex outermembrane receptor protein